MSGNNLPINLGENCVQYRLFPGIIETSDLSNLQKLLQDKLDSYLSHLSPYLVDFIWQNESFTLSFNKKTNRSAESVPAHLYGRTDFQDNVEDEWFIVFLMFELTKVFSSLIVQIFDGDGEFLLIEAAETLPKWLDPDTAENRVFIYGGNLHIVPHKLPSSSTLPTPPPLDPVPNLNTSIQYLRKCSDITKAKDSVQASVKQRISCFPARCREYMHRTRCYIPAALAAVLDTSPSLISSIVRAFYERDKEDLKACSTMKHFRPGTRVLRMVKFNRCLFAQVLQQKFTPDRQSGWNIPPPNSNKFQSYDLGVKLAYGAEILCSRCDSSSTKPNEDSPAEDSAHKQSFNDQDPRWKHFISRLRSSGYFKGEISGSALYQKLLNSAKLFWEDSTNDKEENSWSAGSKILKILSQVTVDVDEMRRQEATLPKSDDESWLDLTPDRLDKMLQKASGRKGHTPDCEADEDNFDMNMMTESMMTFMGSMSGHEGVDYLSEMQIGSSDFMQSMQKTFGVLEDDEDNSCSSSEMSGYSSDEETLEAPKSTAELDKFKTLMSEMDRELSTTEVGKSFKTLTTTQKLSTHIENNAEITKAQLEKINYNTKLNSKAPPVSKAPTAQLDDEFNENLDDSFPQVDLEANLVENLLASYDAQAGLPGPTSTILADITEKSCRISSTNKNLNEK